MKLKTQKEFLKELNELVANNPKVEVMFFIDNYTISEDYDHTKQEIFKIEIDNFIERDSEIIVGEGEGIDKIFYELDDTGEYENKSEGALMDIAEEQFYKECKHAIIVYLSA